MNTLSTIKDRKTSNEINCLRLKVRGFHLPGTLNLLKNEY